MHLPDFSQLNYKLNINVTETGGFWCHLPDSAEAIARLCIG
ncbi:MULTISPECIES: hypothetical protein [unclassified Coleofasciculus]|nr:MULTISPECIES: hypothetical protein [unclassified Coleofasciculus]